MTPNVFVISDHHFWHKNILTFLDEDGKLIRPGFEDVQAMNEYMVKQWNSVVKPKDKVYHLGDAIIGTSAWAFDILNELNGTKVLIKGNHDNAKMSVYMKYFKDVRSYHKLDKYILSHVPIHPQSLSDNINVHGHLHQKEIQDSRYLNVSVELFDYVPLEFSQIKNHLK